jgi:addiction module HigA family antidote
VSVPGKVFYERLARPSELSLAQIARRMGISVQYLCDICQGRRQISARVAVAIEHVFGEPAWDWMCLQLQADLEKAHAKYGPALKREVTP